MTGRDTLRHHAILVDKMANTLGVDLQEAAISGGVSIDEITDAVLRCTDCPNPGHCQNFLAQSEAADRTPEYCRNQDLLKRLMP